MSLPVPLQGRLSLPAIAAPQFLVSGPEYVIAACRAGIVGTFPALNQRTSEAFEDWLVEIKSALVDPAGSSADGPAAPFGTNLVVTDSNPRLEADLEICTKHEVPIVITAIGASSELVDAVHAYGGVVFHDVTKIRHAKSAIKAGVDGLILVCAGAGGHGGALSPFAMVAETRKIFDGTIILAGSISDGRAIAAAQAMGADLTYLGTRFIATRESMASETYKRMIVESTAADIVYTPKISGIPANFLRQSLELAGIDLDTLPGKDGMDLAEELGSDSKAWRDIWSAGQGVGSIVDTPSIGDLVARLKSEYCDAVDGVVKQQASYLSATSIRKAPQDQS